MVMVCRKTGTVLLRWARMVGGIPRPRREGFMGSESTDAESESNHSMGKDRCPLVRTMRSSRHGGSTPADRWRQRTLPMLMGVWRTCARGRFELDSGRHQSVGHDAGDVIIGVHHLVGTAGDDLEFIAAIAGGTVVGEREFPSVEEVASAGEIGPFFWML